MKAMSTVLVMMTMMMVFGGIGCSKGGGSSNNRPVVSALGAATQKHAVTEDAKDVAKTLEGEWDADGMVSSYVFKNGNFDELVNLQIDEKNLNRICSVMVTSEIYDVKLDPKDFMTTYKTRPEFVLESQAVQLTLIDAAGNDSECIQKIQTINTAIQGGKDFLDMETAVTDFAGDKLSLIYESEQGEWIAPYTKVQAPQN